MSSPTAQHSNVQDTTHGYSTYRKPENAADSQGKRQSTDANPDVTQRSELITDLKAAIVTKLPEVNVGTLERNGNIDILRRENFLK